MAERRPPEPDVTPCRPGEELDATAVGRYLEGKIEHARGIPEVWQFPGGHANLTYLIQYPGASYVLRRPPFGDIAPGAHDMTREYRALSRLYKVFPPAPRAFVLCEDRAVIGAPFFVMERRHGVVVRKEVPAAFGGGNDPAQVRKLSEVMVDTMADFHSVDYQAAGLADLGRDPERFLERQVKGWADRWERAKTQEFCAPEVIGWLIGHMPASPPATLVHNDWRLDNMAVAADDPGRCVAVYDWDMCTVGDPFTDLGTVLSVWVEPGENLAFLSAMPSQVPGFLTRTEAIERYGRRRNIDVSNMPYYYAFGLFKMAVVVQQLYARWAKGQTKDARMAGGELGAQALLETARRVIDDLR